MGEQSNEEYIKCLQEMEVHLQKAQSKYKQIDEYFKTEIFIAKIPANEAFLKQSEARFTKNMLQVIECIQKTAPEIQKFNTKVMYASTEMLDHQTKVPHPTFNKTIVESLPNEDLGKLQHAIVEQIEIIDSDKRQNSTYAEMNSIISGRIYYTNKTMDTCIDYLLRNL